MRAIWRTIVPFGTTDCFLFLHLDSSLFLVAKMCNILQRTEMLSYVYCILYKLSLITTISISFQVACVVHCGFIDGEYNNMFISGPDANVVTRDQLKASFLLGESFIDLLFGFSARFSQFELTQSEVALFSSLMLITPGISLYSTEYGFKHLCIVISLPCLS